MSRRICSMEDFEYSTQKVLVDGVWMTLAEKKNYERKKKNAEEKNKKKKARNYRLIPHIPGMIQKMVKGVRLLSNFDSYYHNAYKQWGTIAYEITKNPFIERDFVLFIAKLNDVKKHIQKIEKIGKRDDKDIFGYVQKLYFELDDLKVKLTILTDSISKSGILRNPMIMNKECIVGSKDGKRLGLRQLCSRTSENLVFMENAIKELDKMSFDGCDPMEYFDNGKRMF